MDSYLLSITIIGIACLAMAWMPALTKKTKISYAIIYVIFGAFVYKLIPGLPSPDPLAEKKLTLHLAELVVIISIMGSSLKIDEPFSFKTWIVAFRLVTITMILSITAVTFIAWYFLHLPFATSLLLGATLAPTDPVLASDVQVGPPLEGDKDNVRFSLTAEAGMNDGMAFPFTWLAIVLAGSVGGGSFEGDLLLWFTRDILYRIAAGVFCGYALGRLLAALVINLPDQSKMIQIRDGFVAIAATLLVYGLTEMVKGYGFIAVFVTAITIRNAEMNHKYHRKLHGFTEQVEKVLVAVVLILLGGALSKGILEPIHLSWVIFAFAFLLVIRPLAGYVSLFNIPIHWKEKMAISFFGIRGMGSFFYLAFALNKKDFDHERELWAVVALIVIVSIAIHGLSATTIMDKLSGKYKPISEK